MRTYVMTRDELAAWERRHIAAGRLVAARSEAEAVRLRAAGISAIVPLDAIADAEAAITEAEAVVESTAAALADTPVSEAADRAAAIARRALDVARRAARRDPGEARALAEDVISGMRQLWSLVQFVRYAHRLHRRGRRGG